MKRWHIIRAFDAGEIKQVGGCNALNYLLSLIGKMYDAMLGDVPDYVCLQARGYYPDPQWELALETYLYRWHVYAVIGSADTASLARAGADEITKSSTYGLRDAVLTVGKCKPSWWTRTWGVLPATSQPKKRQRTSARRTRETSDEIWAAMQERERRISEQVGFYVFDKERKE